MSADGETENGHVCDGMNSDIVHNVREKMIEQQAIGDVADLFKVLGDETRAGILVALSEAEMCVCDIAALLGMSHSAISHQLSILKQARIVRNRREGRIVYYRMADNHIMQLLKIAIAHAGEERGR